MAQERVQKILAQAGIASRRKAEALIEAGSVTINGKVAKLGDKADSGKDAIKVQGKLLQLKQTPVYIAFHKPKNVISALTDPQGRPCIGDYLLKVKNRVYPVGRLDFGTEGLIFLTNDGDFTEKMQRNDQVLRVYHVKIKGHPPAATLARIERGGKVGNRYFKPHSVRFAEEFTQKARIEVVIQGGGAFDLKTFFEERGFLVQSIVRTAIGHITLRGMKAGELRYLLGSQMEALFLQPELGQRRLDQDAVKSRNLQTEELEEARVAKNQERIEKAKAARGGKITPAAVVRAPRASVVKPRTQAKPAIKIKPRKLSD